MVKALSYTWGNPSNICLVTINNKTCPVTKNLFLALLRLRYQDISRFLWIDAVCINQTNLTEKSQQVAMMAKIYAMASNVLIWLGEPVPQPGDGSGAPEYPEKIDYQQPVLQWGTNEDIDLIRSFFTSDEQFEDWPVIGALSTLVLMSRNSHFNTLPFFQDPRYVLFDLATYPSKLWQESLHALQEILETPYWNRVWIVQEVFFARQALVHYGRHLVPIEIFFDAERKFRQHYYGCCHTYSASKFNDSKWGGFTSILNTSYPIRAIRELIWARKAGSELSLFEATLSGVDFRLATDPRDYIYASLGLIDERNGTSLFPDYTLSTETIFARAGFNIMQQSGTLQFLAYADRQANMKSLPSWCFQWGFMPPFDPSPYQWDLFNASGSEKALVKLHDDFELELSGLHVDTVRWVGTVRSPVGLELSSLVRWMMLNGEAIIEHCGDPDAPYVGESEMTHEEALWRTLVGDSVNSVNSSDRSSRRATYEDVLGLMSWWGWILSNVSPQTRDWPTKNVPERFTDLLESFLDRTQSRAFFTTRDSRMGTCVAKAGQDLRMAETGDHVVLLKGCNVPVILRHMPTTDIPETGGSKDSDSGRRIQRFRFIGTCYVQGIMDGEACQGREEEFGEMRLGGSACSAEPANRTASIAHHAVMLSLMLGHGRGRNKAPSLRHGQEQVVDHEECIDAERLVFPTPRQWDESLKPLRPERVMLSEIFQGLPPETDDEAWDELWKKMAEDMGSR